MFCILQQTEIEELLSFSFLPLVWFSLVSDRGLFQGQLCFIKKRVKAIFQVVHVVVDDRLKSERAEEEQW